LWLPKHALCDAELQRLVGEDAAAADRDVENRRSK
jgi:hypothetical protein